MVDLGITFAGPDEPGVEIVYPDIRFIEEERANLLGIVLTHAHEDHFGAVAELWPRLQAPIWATPFTAALLRAKYAEQGGSGDDFPLHEVALGERFAIGPFDIELVTMAHSIPEPNALAIRTPLGLVLHSGDWKLDPNPIVGAPTDAARLRALGAEGVDALICDSTNALRDGVSPSEEDVARTLTEIIAGAERRVAVTTFASNVARLRSVAAATRAAGRHLVVVGRAMHRVILAARESGHIRPDFHYHSEDEFAYLEPKEVVLLCTGSQGERRAALSRIAAGEHPNVALSRGDLVIFSSRTIPGNEKSVGAVQNNLADRGVRVLTDADGLVHVSGHPRRGELARLYEWLRPRAAVPMHGEPRHLEAHAAFARAQGVEHVAHARNGTMVRLLPGPVEIIDEAPVGRLLRDGRLLVPAEGGPVRERRKLSFVGIAVLTVSLTRSGDIAADPDVILDGIPETDADGVPMEERVLDAVDGALESIPRARRRDPDLVREAVRRAARSALFAAWGKKPICKVMVQCV